ncbi:MAG TPA: 4'-phosphopantetheinyl transferase superfamily protein [Polyangia bacterium]|nr:4'-phosphopantetheinyl transferase superfamily protein [Polyangia bacterium]
MSLSDFSRAVADFARGGALGRLSGVALPDEADAAGLAALVARLPPAERVFAASLAPARRATWAGGRVALRTALAALGVDAPSAIFATPRGAPSLPAGVVGSIAHKDTLAVALAARGDAAEATVGVDLELPRAPRVDIAKRVLVERERAWIDALPTPEARARALMTVFAAKEALYKALDPWLGRFVAFREAEISRMEAGALAGRFFSRAGERAFAITFAEEEVSGFVVVAARCRPTDDPPDAPIVVRASASATS